MEKLNGMPVHLPGPLPKVVFVNWLKGIDSSNVQCVGWDNEKNMYVCFMNGGQYVYHGVSRQRAVATAHAKSVGHYINTHIKPNYECTRLV